MGLFDAGGVLPGKRLTIGLWLTRNCQLPAGKDSHNPHILPQ